MTLLEYKSMSLPYGLKAQFPATNEKGCREKVIGTIHAVYDDGSITCYDTVNATPDTFRLILRPLSDLVKEIEYKGEEFVPIVELAKMVGISQYTALIQREQGYVLAFEEWKFIYHTTMKSFNLFHGSLAQVVPNQLQMFQFMVSWHFDIANLIEKGDAIDVNTLKVNPYK